MRHRPQELHERQGVAQRLRKNGLKCRTVQITLKDANFRVTTRQGKLNVPSYTTAEIAERAMELLRQNYSFKLPVRLIGVTAADLVDLEAGEQLTLFDDTARHKRLERLESSLDFIQNKFGENAIRRAILTDEDFEG